MSLGFYSRFNSYKPDLTPKQKKMRRYNPGSAFTLSSKYGVVRGKNDIHTGTDYAAPKGTNIPAPADGEVWYFGENKTYGNTVILRHKDKDGKVFYSLLAHMGLIKKLELKQKIVKGEILGTVGNTGKSTGDHLHHEVIVTPDGKKPARSDTGGPIGIEKDKYRVDPDKLGEWVDAYNEKDSSYERNQPGYKNPPQKPEKDYISLPNPFSDKNQPSPSPKPAPRKPPPNDKPPSSNQTGGQGGVKPNGRTRGQKRIKPEDVGGSNSLARMVNDFLPEDFEKFKKELDGLADKRNKNDNSLDGLTDEQKKNKKDRRHGNSSDGTLVRVGKRVYREDEKGDRDGEVIPWRTA